MSKKHWNITRCRTEANYTFWIADYFREKDIPMDITFSFLDKTIIDFRNEGVVKTKYFKSEKEAIEFIEEWTKEGII